MFAISKRLLFKQLLLILIYKCFTINFQIFSKNIFKNYLIPNVFGNAPFAIGV